MSNKTLKELEIQARFNNHLFLIFKEGFSEILNLFNDLNYEKKKLITNKLAELNKLIDELNQTRKDCDNNFITTDKQNLKNN